MKVKNHLLFFLLLFSTQVWSQIVDDSTKMVYGPTSTRYMTVGDLKHSDTLFHAMDTSLYDFSSFQTKKKQKEYSYDLGNNGTAITPIYYAMPSSIGRTTGFNAYDPFVKTAEDFKYYDTKSPFIRLGVVFGGSSRSTVDFEFARNITPNWNVGFDIHRIASNKQLGSASLRESQVLNTGLDIHTFYRGKKRKYHLMLHAYRGQHEVTETGGILTSTLPEDYFKYQDAAINLTTAYSADERTRYYLYHQYSLKPYFELYNVIELNKAVNEFVDTQPVESNGSSFYNNPLISQDETSDASQMDETKVEVGIKGRIANRIYYSGYVKRRDLKFKYNFLNPNSGEAENYLGGDLSLLITKKNEIGGQVEVMDQGLYFFKGYFKNNFLTGSYSSSLYSPSFMVDNYFGNHYEWHNDFNPTFANSIQGAAFYEFPFVRLEAQVEVSSVTDYIYFNHESVPSQNSGTVLINKYGAKVDFNINKKIRFENHVVFNNFSGDNPEVMRAPDLNYFGKWYYADILFKGDMETHVGFDIRWQSEFYGRSYDPVTQQFYLQNDLQVDKYLAVDFFFIVKSNDLTLFFKINYLNQQREKGYFEVPYYPGMRRVFDMGLRWMFFD